MSSNGSSKQMTVVDYGLGNLFSIERALTHLGARVEITSDPQTIRQAKALVLPGVGAFGDGMEQLRSRGLIGPILEATGAGRPLLGICLGMQLLFSESEEFGLHEGLGLIEGTVVRLRDSDTQGNRIKVPHVGWSELFLPPGSIDRDSTLLEGLTPGDAMYFVHSYVPVPQNDSVTVAQIRYGGYPSCALVEQGEIVGCQFHPEKSGEAGLKLLGNFIR